MTIEEILEALANWPWRPVTWMRYGYWSEDGTILWKAYETASDYNGHRIIYEARGYTLMRHK